MSSSRRRGKRGRVGGLGGGRFDDLAGWGQVGSDGFDLWVFDQGEIWVDRSGALRRLAEMSDVEVAELVGYLEVHVEHFYSQCLQREILAALLGSALTADSDSLAERDDAGTLLSPENPLHALTPGEWGLPPVWLTLGVCSNQAASAVV
jgi:hypothetical protein